MRYVIIGASAAGLTAAKTIRALKPRSEITVVSIDTQVYSRCMLHFFLGGSRTVEGIHFLPATFFEDNEITWQKGERVCAVDAARNELTLASGGTLPYDRLLLACGADFVVPPLPHFREAHNVYGLRGLSDANAIAAVAEAGKRCVIVGSGLVGLDAAEALCARGVACSIVEMAGNLSPLQLDTAAAARYQTLFEQHGCTFYLAEKASDTATDADGNIVSVSLASGPVLPCDFVVAAAGVRPSIGFLEGSGIETDRAVKVDDRLRTNQPNVWAAGDVAGISGVWPSAMHQGEAAAKNMCGADKPYIDGNGARNVMNFYGLMTLSLGVNTVLEGDTVLARADGNNYRRFVLRDGVVTHAILLGDLSSAILWQDLIHRKVPVGHLEKSVFDLSRADFPHA